MDLNVIMALIAGCIALAAAVLSFWQVLVDCGKSKNDSKQEDCE